jgi:hypothetical protein
MKKISFCTVILTLITVFCSCSGDDKEQLNSITRKYQSILINCENTTPNTIEVLMLEIERYLERHPKSEKKSDLANYVFQLKDCYAQANVKVYINKYEQLISKTYASSNLKEIIEHNEKFINELNSKEDLLAKQSILRTYMREIASVNNEIIKIDQFINHYIFNSVNDFYNLTQSNAYLYENSKYECVQECWELAVKWKRDSLIENEIEKMTENFETYLKNDAEKICTERFDGSYFSGFVLDTKNPTHRVEIGTPTNHADGYTGKQCEGIFRVNMIGNGVGWDKKSVKIKIIGGIFAGIDENKIVKEIFYKNKDYSILEQVGN